MGIMSGRRSRGEIEKPAELSEKQKANALKKKGAAPKAEAKKVEDGPVSKGKK